MRSPGARRTTRNSPSAPSADATPSPPRFWQIEVEEAGSASDATSVTRFHGTLLPWDVSKSRAARGSSQSHSRGVGHSSRWTGAGLLQLFSEPPGRLTRCRGCSPVGQGRCWAMSTTPAWTTGRIATSRGALIGRPPVWGMRGESRRALSSPRRNAGQVAVSPERWAANLASPRPTSLPPMFHRRSRRTLRYSTRPVLPVMAAGPITGSVGALGWPRRVWHAPVPEVPSVPKPCLSADTAVAHLASPSTLPVSGSLGSHALPWWAAVEGPGE